MGTWISHLRVAEHLLAAWPDVDPAAFACGNLAPDCGIPNADWSAFDPPKVLTHFLRAGEDEGRCQDLVYYRTYLANPATDSDLAHYSSRLGYFCHLVCDNLWMWRVVRPSKQEYAALFADRAQFWDRLKRDWYGLDFQYLQDQPASLFWRVFRPAPNPPPSLPFIPTAALHAQLDMIRAYYTTLDPEVAPLARPYPYLNAATMDRFVADAAQTLLELRQRLQTGAIPPSDSVRDMLPDSQTAPYPSPLGDDQPHQG